MPRDSGTGQYSKPIPAAIPNTTIASTPYNLNVDDVVIDLNTPRPVVAGGTGATNAHDARSMLGAEMAMATVTDYDTHVFENGSFWSGSSAINGPVAARAFGGTAIIPNNDPAYMYIQVHDINDAINTPGKNYTREKKAGVWGSWVLSEQVTIDLANSKVARAGDTMSGDLSISKAYPRLFLACTAGTNSTILFSTAGADNWGISTDTTVFNIATVGGAATGTMSISRSSGDATFGGFLRAIGNFVSNGYYGRAGQGGAESAQAWNFNWVGALDVWVQTTRVGTVTITSDYRTKKDVIDLPGMWETVKALRPIKYTQADFNPPSEIKRRVQEVAKDAAEGREAKPAPGPFFPADDVERWGFVAHELQATLIPSAATGVKDSPDTIQSPNPFTLLAAVTRALQEAMARIEALEALARKIEAL